MSATEGDNHVGPRPRPRPQPEPQEGGFAIDIRLFLVMMALSMGVSFYAGVAYGPIEFAPPPLPTATVVPPDAAGSAAGRSSLAKLQPSQKYDHGSTNGDEQHLPAGQHLLLDMQGVDPGFLNDEERLSKAMVQVVKESKLTLLSYHCHALTPTGVSCVGVLLESHISFHTWPEDGVITLDLFTCGSKPLLPAVQVMQRLFGIPAEEGGKVRSRWSHELRGFRSDEARKKNYLDGSSDLSLWVLSPLQLYSKEQIYSNMTKFQRIDIWDIVEATDTPSYADVIKYNMSPGDPRLSGPEYVSPDRLLFLDGTLQSLQSTEVVYHEAMVHPAMFAHPHPETVVIVGGGEGATLREVLKHKTVKTVVMIEIDEEMVHIAQRYLPTYSNCSDLLDRAPNCFEDPLADIRYEDATKWFLDRYGPNPTKEPLPALIDVILLDALDPEEENDMSDYLYTDTEFYNAVLKSLSPDGVLAIQVGTAATIDDPRADVGIYKNREKLFNLLEEHDDVGAMLVYEEAHGGFLEPHSFLIVSKTPEVRSRWYARNDLRDYEIYDRIVRTRSKKRALQYYDGTTQHLYQWPKKGWETVYCRREPTPYECAYRWLDFKAELHEIDLGDESKSSFRYELETKNGKEEARLFATRNIPEGSYIMPTHLASSLEVTTKNVQGLENNVVLGGGRVPVIEDLLGFFDTYLHESTLEGSSLNYVEIGGTCLMRRVDGDDEPTNVRPWLLPHPGGRRPKYSPVYERHRVAFDVFIVASRNIKAGEELTIHKDAWKALKLNSATTSTA